MRVLLVLCLAGCGGSLAPPDPGDTQPVTGAGFIGVAVSEGTTGTTVVIDRRAMLVDALSAPATCHTAAPSTASIVGGAISAGTIEVDDLGKVVLQPNADGSYPDPGASSTTDLMTGGMLVASASGGDIPAFRLSLTAPPEVTVFAPDPANSPAMLDRTQPISLAWHPMPGYTIRFALYANDLVLACDFPGEVGAGTLPGAEVAKLGAADADLVATVTSSTSVTSGAVPVVLQATLEANDMNGNPYLYAFMLQ